MGKKMVFLYAGYHGDRDNITYNYNSVHIANGFPNVSEFVICSGQYPHYFDDNGNINEEAQTNYINAVANLIKSLPGTKNFWVGTPFCEGVKTSAGIDKLGKTQVKFIENLKQKLDNEGRTHRLNGIYMHSEEPTAKRIEMYKVVADYVHNTLKKQFLWAPYYGSGTVPNIGTVIGAGIFDYVMIQPHYYFAINSTNQDNSAAIRKSMRDQRLYYRDLNTLVAGASNPKTKIGCQMEIDPQFYTDSNNTDAYNAYYDKCFSNVSTAPMGTLSGYNKANSDFSFYCDHLSGTPTPQQTQTYKNMMAKVTAFYN